MSIVVCKLPRTGLGNQLFPLLKASAFAQLNNLPLKIVGYHQWKLGPYLRGDKIKRNYKGYFTFQKGWIKELSDWIAIFKTRGYRKISEPLLDKRQSSVGNQQFLFTALPHWSDYFTGLKAHRQLVTQCLLDILSPDIRQRYHSGESPVIGVHVRMGDFRKMKEGEDFSKLGVVRTPMDYFIRMISLVREVHGSQLPVSVFTDGYKDELQQLMDVGNIKIVEGNPDIIDLLLLSKSKLIITSTGSTFSYWAGFLSEAILLMHPQHLHKSIRPESMQGSIYEGPFNADNSVLVKNIKAIA